MRSRSTRFRRKPRSHDVDRRRKASGTVRRENSILSAKGFDTNPKRIRYVWGKDAMRIRVKDATWAGQLDERDPGIDTWRFLVILDSSESESWLALRGPRSHVALELRTMGSTRGDDGALCPCRRGGVHEGATWTPQDRRKHSILDGRRSRTRRKKV